jgi:hypothetical protein
MLVSDSLPMSHSRFSGPPLDVWALGVILFALLCGRLPYEGPDLAGTKRPRDAVIRSRISKGQYKIEEGLSPEAKDLVRRMLRIDPSIRASVPEIFSHVWMRTPSQNYDPHHSTIREKDVMSPLSLIQKLSLSASPPAAVVPTAPGTDSQISTPRTSLKVILPPSLFLISLQLPNLVATVGDEEVPVIEMIEDPITAQSSSETELENLPTFDMDRVVTKLCSNSTEGSAEDAIETLLSGRRSSSRSGRPPLSVNLTPLPHTHSPSSLVDPDEVSSSASPKASFILVPLRRNPQQGPKDLIPSPRRPKTAVDDEEFLARFRQETWDIPGEEPSIPTTTSRGRSGTEGSDGAVRVRQSTGSLSARLHPLQLRKHDNNGDSSSPSFPTSVTSSPSAGAHTARSHSQRKSIHPTSGPPTSTWTEQLEEAKETLDTSIFNESGKHSSRHPTDHHRGGTLTGSSLESMPFSSQNRTKHSQLHFAGTSSLKPHTSINSTSQPSTPTQSRRKLPATSSSHGMIHRTTFAATSASDHSTSPALVVSGQGTALANGGSETPNFLSSTGRTHSFRAGTSGSSSRLTAKASGEATSSSTAPNKLHR